MNDAVTGSPRRLRTDVLLSFANKGTVLVVQTVALVLVARELGPSGRGALAVAMSFALVLVQIGTAGLVSANPYFLAQERGLRGVIAANSLGIAAVLGGALVLLGVGVKLLLPDAIAGLSWTMVGVAVATIPPMLAMLFLQSVLLGEGRTVAYNAVEAGLSLGVLVALVLGFWAFDMGVVGVLSIYLANSLLGAAIFLALLLGDGGLAAPRLALVRRMLGYASRVYVATLLLFLVIRLDLLLVNGYLGNTQAGVYTIATGIADALFVIPYAIGLNLFPRIAAGGAAADTATVFRSVAILYGLLCLGVAVVAGPLISLLLGVGFEDAAGLYWWLTPGVWSMGMLTILTQHFIGRGFPVQAVVIWVAGLVVNVAINVAFLERAGTYIAPLSSSLAYGLLLALHLRLLSREVGGYGPLRPRLREVVPFLRSALGRGT